MGAEYAIHRPTIILSFGAFSPVTPDDEARIYIFATNTKNAKQTSSSISIRWSTQDTDEIFYGQPHIPKLHYISSHSR